MYYFMNKDTILAEFDIQGSGELESCIITKVYNELPPWIDNLQTWLTNRNAAKHRLFVKKLLEDLQSDTLSGFIRLTHCLSLTDTLWVKSDNENVLWDGVSLYRNKFNYVLSRLSFDGNGLYGLNVPTTSPELTTDGSFDKCWINEDEDICLVKAGSSGASNLGREPYSEVIASPIFEELCGGIKYVLDRYHGRVVSKCKLFTTEDIGYKPYCEIFPRGGDLVTIMDEYAKYGSDDIFRRMILADCVTINRDRHFANFGFFVDNNTFDILGINSPFDYNLAMFPDADWYEGFTDMSLWQEKRKPVLGKSYKSVAESLLNNTLRSELKNLKDLVLTIECDSKFDSERLEIVNRFKNIQIDNLLGISRQFYFEDIRDRHRDNKTTINDILKRAEGNK